MWRAFRNRTEPTAPHDWSGPAPSGPIRSVVRSVWGTVKRAAGRSRKFLGRLLAEPGRVRIRKASSLLLRTPPAGTPSHARLGDGPQARLGVLGPVVPAIGTGTVLVADFLRRLRNPATLACLVLFHADGGADAVALPATASESFRADGQRVEAPAGVAFVGHPSPVDFASERNSAPVGPTLASGEGFVGSADRGAVTAFALPESRGAAQADAASGLVRIQDRRPYWDSSDLFKNWNRTYRQGVEITTLQLPRAKGGDGNITYSLRGSLAPGLRFSARQRQISGTPTAAKANTRYYYTARDADGDTTTFDFWITVLPTLPAKPADLAVAAGFRRAILTWSPVHAADRWQHRKKAGSGEYGSWTDIGGSDSDTTTAIVMQLENGVTYTFQVRGLNAAGGGLPSDEATATPLDPPLAPAEFRARVGDGRVMLIWSGLSGHDAARWQFRYRAAGESYTAWIEIRGSGGATGSHTVTGLENGVEYGFQIRGVNAGGVGAETVELRAVPRASAERSRMTAQALAGLARTLLGDATGAIARRPGSAFEGPARSQAEPGAKTSGSYGGSTLRHADRSVSRRPGIELVPAGSGGAGWSVWGMGARQEFERTNGAGLFEGRQRSSWLGAERRVSRSAVAGLAAARSFGEVDHPSGSLRMSLWAAWPYLEHRNDSGAELRVLVGAGRGEVKLSGADWIDERVRVKMRSASLGVRWPALQGREGTLSLLGDAGVLRLDTDRKPHTAVGGLSVAARQIRAGVEGVRAARRLPGTSFSLAPRVALTAARESGHGDAETGLEVSGAVRMTAPDLRAVVEAQGHWLAWHSSGHARSWGASVELRLKHRTDGSGMSLAVRPQVGRSAAESGSFDEWPRHASVSARADYGFGPPSRSATAFAQGDLGRSPEGSRRLEVGIEFGLESAARAVLSVKRPDADLPDRRVEIGLNLRF